MQTRIRFFRKQRGWTLQQLAETIGTTAQTVQRLETANMTVSMDWLQRFADAFEIHPADLLETPAARNVPMLGRLGRDGALRGTAGPAAAPQSLSLDIPADDPIAVQLEERINDYGPGTILIANRLTGADMTNAVGRNALLGLSTGAILLGRVIRGKGDTYTLVPLRPQGDVRYDLTPDWIARIVMTVGYV